MKSVFKAPDIECGGCAASIRKVLSSRDGVIGVDVEVEAKTVTVEYDSSRTSSSRIEQDLEDAGFPAHAA